MTVATRPGSATSVVFDASLVVRAIADGDADALAWLGRVAEGGLSLHWPSLVYPEVANAVLTLERARRITHDTGSRLLRAIFDVKARLVPVERLVEEAWALAAARDLSVYDASYAVLAETLRAPLVTADRRLADATANAVLIGG